MAFGKNKQEKMDNAATPAGAELPPFFINPQIISLEHHEKAKLRKKIPLKQIGNTNCVPLTLAEMMEAAKHYPIVFTAGDIPMPMAVVGLENKNYYFSEESIWEKNCYVPAYVRKYPFVFMQTPEDQLVLCIDEPALAFGEKEEGDPLYQDGKPSPLSQSALEFCAIHSQEHRLTEEFGKLLKENKLLKLHNTNVELANGREISLDGFQLIDPDQLKGLPDSLVLDWYKRDYIAAVNYILQSISNWKNLLERANLDEPASNTLN